MSGSGDNKLTHIALLPSSGMGHLTPFLRLAALFSKHGLRVTLIAPQPTVSLAESQALSNFSTDYPLINQMKFNLLPLEKDGPTYPEDPFYYHFEVIRHSSQLLFPLLSSLLPPLSALVTDMSLASTVLPITKALDFPNYIFFTSSAKMLTLFVSFHALVDSEAAEVVKIPNSEPLPKSWIPPPLLQDTNNNFKTYLSENGKKMATESSGILVNSFESLEHETLEKLNGGKILKGLPPVFTVGPLAPCKSDKTKKQNSSSTVAWLDKEPTASILYVNFGSRTAMSREQMTELGEALLMSGYKFIWVVKDKKIDREDLVELSEIMGLKLRERLSEKGHVIKDWIEQEEVLGHRAIGAFLSHCGWNSVTEAIRHGMPILAWPQHGDQKINASIVKRIGMGKWVEDWGWGGDKLVKADNIAKEVMEIMRNKSFRIQAMSVREEARKAVDHSGTSVKNLTQHRVLDKGSK